MTSQESGLWLDGWRPVSDDYPRKEWIDPETGEAHQIDEAVKIASKRKIQGAG